MLSAVLSSKRAIMVNVAIMRAFIRLRQTLALHKELQRKLSELEQTVEGHDSAIRNQRVKPRVKPLLRTPFRFSVAGLGPPGSK